MILRKETETLEKQIIESCNKWKLIRMNDTPQGDGNQILTILSLKFS